MSLWKHLFELFPFIAMFVSILVLVDVALKGSCSPIKNVKNKSFNPCFRGCRSEREEKYTRQRHPHCFNPCFRGCRSEREFWGCNERPCCAVSILVFVDVALKAFTQRRRPAENGSFNPCFRGCRSESRRTDCEPFIIRWFQSLFSWMSLWKEGVRDTDVPAHKGFNPCFRGCRSERRFAKRFRAVELEFQSLFSWMSLWKALSW